MTIDLVKEISGMTFKTIIIVGGPLLLTAMTIGLLISFIQSVVQIQDMALTFVPKILGVFFAAFVLMPWLSRSLISFTVNLIHNIPAYIR